jgi:hypothetical protein
MCKYEQHTVNRTRVDYIFGLKRQLRVSSFYLYFQLSSQQRKNRGRMQDV